MKDIKEKNAVDQVPDDLMDETDLMEEAVEENAEEETEQLSPENSAADSMPPAYWANPEDTSVFKAVDRNSEDLAVVRYQQLRDSRTAKSQQLFEQRRSTIHRWAKTFRELGRTQEAVEKRLGKVWEKCLTVRETNGGLDFPALLRQSMLADLQSLAVQGKKERLWERLQANSPEVEALASEDALFREYLIIIDQMNELLGELYALREPTMKVWAKRYHYLASSEEEMFAELRLIWVRCVNDYEYEAKERVVATFRGHHVHSKSGVKKKVKKTTNFNTYKFSSFRNFIVNQLKKKYKCKKRIDERGVPYEQTMMSLDHQYDEKDGDGVSLHDVVAAPMRYEGRSLAVELWIDRILEHSSIKKDSEMRYALEKLAYDPHIKTLEAACRLRSGVVEVDNADRDLIYTAQAIKDTSWKELLRDLIVADGLYKDGFSIESAQIYPKSIGFEIKVRDASLLLRTKKAIKAAKLEKEFKLA